MMSVNSVLSECVVGMSVRQNCGGRLGAASGLRTPAFTSISTDRRWWWMQRRISIKKPAQSADMNSPMRRCRHEQTPPLFPFVQYLFFHVKPATFFFSKRLQYNCIFNTNENLWRFEDKPTFIVQCSHRLTLFRLDYNQNDLFQVLSKLVQIPLLLPNKS